MILEILIFYFSFLILKRITKIARDKIAIFLRHSKPLNH